MLRLSGDYVSALIKYSQVSRLRSSTRAKYCFSFLLLTLQRALQFFNGHRVSQGKKREKWSCSKEKNWVNKFSQSTLARDWWKRRKKIKAQNKIYNFHYLQREWTFTFETKIYPHTTQPMQSWLLNWKSFIVFFNISLSRAFLVVVYLIFPASSDAAYELTIHSIQSSPGWMDE